MENSEAVEILGGLPRSNPVLVAIRTLVNARASVVKTMLFSGDFSGREYAAGKAIGFLDAMEYIRDLPGDCAKQLAAAKEETK